LERLNRVGTWAQWVFGHFLRSVDDDDHDDHDDEE
jgi:hypothetical protein